MLENVYLILADTDMWAKPHLIFRLQSCGHRKNYGSGRTAKILKFVPNQHTNKLFNYIFLLAFQGFRFDISTNSLQQNDLKKNFLQCSEFQKLQGFENFGNGNLNFFESLK